MGRLFAALVSAAFVTGSGAALAHHSFAMFDTDHPMSCPGDGR